MSGCGFGRVLVIGSVPNDEVCKKVRPEIASLFDGVNKKDIFITIAFQILESGGDVEGFVEDFERWLMCKEARGELPPEEASCLWVLANAFYWDHEKIKHAIEMYRKHFDRRRFEEFIERVKPGDTDMFGCLEYAKEHGFKAFEKRYRELFDGFDREFLETLRLIIEHLDRVCYFDYLGRDRDVPKKLRQYPERGLNPDLVIEWVKEELEDLG